jgi:DNA-binding transcriptional LysR family regulator
MNLDSVDLRKLRALYLTAKHGSLRRAAARLNLTVPAVSFKIRRLEEDLGVELFQRLPNRLVLTQAGESFVAEVEAIFDRVEKAFGTLSSRASPAGRLTVSIGSDVAWYFAPKISAFMKRFPAVELSLQIHKASETLDLLTEGAVDVGVNSFSKVPKGLQREIIVRTSLSLACAPDHPLLRRKTPPRLEEIARHKLLVLPRHSTTRKMIERTFADAGLKPRGFMESGNCLTARAFAERDVGLAIVHTLCARHEPSMRLSYVDLGPAFGRIDLSAVYRKGVVSPARDRLLEEMASP